MKTKHFAVWIAVRPPTRKPLQYITKFDEHNFRIRICISWFLALPASARLGFGKSRTDLSRAGAGLHILTPVAGVFFFIVKTDTL